MLLDWRVWERNKVWTAPLLLLFVYWRVLLPRICGLTCSQQAKWGRFKGGLWSGQVVKSGWLGLLTKTWTSVPYQIPRHAPDSQTCLALCKPPKWTQLQFPCSQSYRASNIPRSSWTPSSQYYMATWYLCYDEVIILILICFSDCFLKLKFVEVKCLGPRVWTFLRILIHISIFGLISREWSRLTLASKA